MTNRQSAPPPDAVVVGAGLAGLACALDLCGAGLRVELLEASDGVGGRMRTDREDGFLLDRGFQVFTTSYSQVKKRYHAAERSPLGALASGSRAAREVLADRASARTSEK